MALIQSVTCDVCSIPKREANHWFTYLDDGGGQITFFPWSERDFRQHGHLCSERCCMTVLSRTLTRWSHREAA